MANIKSSQKDIRRTVARTARNVIVQSRIKTLRKKVISSVEAADAGKLATASQEFSAALDKAAKRGVIHPNKANREKSRLARKARALAAAATPAAQ
jgi:small subunit ribosomal protein S20